MANGWYGTDEEWKRIEAPLGLLDPELDRFAHIHGLTLERNFKEPNRSLTWGAEVRCVIQIYLADESVPTLSFWICASQDRDGSRFWKHERLRDGMQASALAGELSALLEDGKRKLDYWAAHPEELQFATVLARVR
jgi:hypothetical protein